MIEQVKGTQNISGDNAIKYLYIQNLFNNKFSDYGYQYIQTPLLEYKELFDKSIGESSEIVTKQMYELVDKGGRELVLRPEGTSSIVRYHAEFNKDLTIKYSYFGSMFRYENPQKNRYREFNQAGVEIVGLIDTYSDFQIINDSFNFINELIPGTKLNINTIGSISDREQYIKVLYEYFHKNTDKLSKDSIDKLENNTLRILDSNNPDDSEVIRNAPNISEYINDNSKNNFYSLLEILNSADIEYQIDNSLVRGLDYYNDLTFEFITSENVVVGGGGRYDNLAEILSLGKFNGVGVAFGVERIMNSIPLPDSTCKYYLLGTDINKIAKYTKELDRHNINYSKPTRLSKENAQFKDAKNQNVIYLINTDEDTIKNLITNQIEKFNIEVILEH
uniref:Histidine--tRNA ligase n=1 Tax=Candidatus Actinomarina minuta TaxID=1389454 RepID=S5DPQ9_9ACTN|nr:histidyl-tRNA synthetase [Candidatus Actinomarina minuta]